MKKNFHIDSPHTKIIITYISHKNPYKTHRYQHNVFVYISVRVLFYARSAHI